MQGEIMQNENRYCVYLHRRKDNNEIFYVGSGSLRRPFGKNSRNEKWHKIVKTYDYLVEIIKSNLNKDKSLELEEFYLSKFVNTSDLVNLTKPCKNNNLDFNYFNEYVYYDETSPTCLRWKVQIVYGANKRVREIGDTAGNLSFNSNSRKLTIQGKSYALHRIVWLLNNGPFDYSKVVDHIDGNHNNNLISNLRLVSQEQNMRNKSGYGKSKISGVNKIIGKTGKPQSWRAQIVNNNGKNIQKYFSISKYGEEEAFRLACQWRKEQIEQLNANGAGYTERHGT